MSFDVCSINTELKKLIHKFRFRRETTNAALIMKVDADKQEIILEESLEPDDIDELRNSIPDTQPRFVLLSWRIEHKDGRTSFPLAFVFCTPRDCKPQLQMMYAGSYKHVIAECSLTKVFQIRDLDELDEEWIQDNLVK